MKKELTTRFYVLERDDGAITIMRLVKDAHIDAEVARWEASGGRKVTRVTPILEEEVPQDRHFRNAWTFDGKKFDIDLDKAKDIQKRHIQRAVEKELRDPLAPLTLSDERKARLLDIHTNFDVSGAKTPEDLKNLWPEDLAK